MQYRRLGTAGIQVSVISLGGWLTYGGSVEDNTAEKCIRTAIENGINFIDMADVYAGGEAERLAGAALKPFRRSHLVLSSKVFWPMSDNVNDCGLSRKHIRESVHASLKRLGTEYLDIYFAHRHDAATSVEEVVRAMDDLIHQGKLLYWGVPASGRPRRSRAWWGWRGSRRSWPMPPTLIGNRTLFLLQS